MWYRPLTRSSPVTLTLFGELADEGKMYRISLIQNKEKMPLIEIYRYIWYLDTVYRATVCDLQITVLVLVLYSLHIYIVSTIRPLPVLVLHVPVQYEYRYAYRVARTLIVYSRSVLVLMY